MHHHGAWHLARTPKAQVKLPDRPAWEHARMMVGPVKFRNQPGAGREFLKFHRDMTRRFRWLVENTHGNQFEYSPWPDIPNWLCAEFPSSYLETAQARIRQLVQGSDDDALGAFIEATQYGGELGSDLHNRIHGVIGWKEYEEAIKTNDPVVISNTTATSMDNFDVAHGNEHFWGLHGCIDNLYADWERSNGIEPDQSPLEPSAGDSHMLSTSP